ncbi:uncharacterized protein [Misgurnus anguillicaudatus]|uniref:uncharacterized protein isoform X1 n=2 Tax=Misgurnus anguillicaudatus TaxID=75329 RepID=UPI003CCF7B63
MDFSEQTGIRRFEREECYHYLANFPQRQESGCRREVNVLVISEVATRSVFMKLRRSSVLKGPQQNVKGFQASKSNTVSKHGSSGMNAGSTCSEISSVVLSDTDCSQSDGNVFDLTVVRDIKEPPKRSRGGTPNQLIEEEMPKFIKSQADSSRTVQKISLAPAGMAEDTLRLVRLMSKGPYEFEGESVEECGSSALDISSSEFLVKSGPSSPNLTVNTARCRECESLFGKMRRQPPSKTKNRDKNPASLSCDQWILLKEWHPQKARHRKKGLLWTSLIQIRKLALQGSVFKARSQTVCSRPHVFQQRNLRRCKYLASIQTDLSLTKPKLQHRKRRRPVAWPPVGGYKPVKRKSSMNNTLSQQLLSPELTISKTQKSKPQLVELSVLSASSKMNSHPFSKQKRNNVQDKQEACNGVEGTRRVLKFDDTPEVVAVETAEKNQDPRRRFKSGRICESQNGVETKDSNCPQEEFFEDSDDFKTPTDLFRQKPVIERGCQQKVPASGDTKHTLQTANFRSMLATMAKNQNKIIKETVQ